MSLVSFSFLLYLLPFVLILWYALPKGLSSLRLGLLLAASIVFAFCVQPKCLAFLAVCTLICFFSALLVQKIQNETGRKSVYLIGMTLLALMLVFYKLAASVNGRSGLLIPVGISFFTFSAVSYLTDCYRGTVRAERNFAKLGLYFSFFPKLMQGPITRYGEFSVPSKPAPEAVVSAVERFIVGLAKKVLLASAMASMADHAFSAASPDALSAWLGIIAYAMQIFFDFAGYTDMAIGLAMLFGIRLPENFRYPYTAVSVTDFWRRWHISLSAFFRDYVYIPLGGNREGMAKQIRNILIVWLLTGLWHGFTLNYLLWAAWFAVLLIAEKLFFGKLLKKIPPVFGRIYTLAAVLLSWVFFRAGSVPAAFAYLGAMFGAGNQSSALFYVKQYGIELALCLLLSAPVGEKVFGLLEKNNLGKLIKAVFLLLIFILSILERNGASLNAFVYAQF